MDGQVKNQIDHIIIGKKWRHSLLEIHVIRQADVGSDYMLERRNCNKIGKDEKSNVEISGRYNIQ